MDAHLRRVGTTRPRDYAPLIAALAISSLLAQPSALAELPSGDTLPPAIATITETSVDHFLDGDHSGTGIGEGDAQSASGHLRLLPALNDLFLAPDLSAIWHATRPSGGFDPIITDGVLDVQERDDDVYAGSAIESWTGFDPEVVLDTRTAIYPGSAFVNVGLMDETASPSQWAYFSTRGSGDGPIPTLYTSVRGADGQMENIPTTVTLGQWHDFKIVWAGDTVEFHVDGVLIDARTGVAFSEPLHAAYYKSSGSDSPLLVDWVRVTPHVVAAGQYVSIVLDAGLAAAPWTTVDWQGDLPAGSTVTVDTRTGETAVPDAGWSNWSVADGSLITSPAARYAQYRITLETPDASVSPVVDEVRISYTYPDAEPPTVVAAVPAPDADAVPVDATIMAVFSEALDAATVTAGSVVLSPGVTAAVSYDPDTFTATLAPTGPLNHGVTYEARITTAVTDLDGNPLAGDYIWTFTTAPVDLTPPTIVAAVPAAGDIDVVATRPITVTVDELLDPTTVTPASITVSPVGDSPLTASVAYDAATRRITITPQEALDRATPQEVRLTTTVADLAGNQLAEDLAWSFTTSYLDAADLTTDTDSEFAAATLTGLQVSEADNAPASGQVRLASIFEDRFDAAPLSDQWEVTNPEGHVPVITDGVLDVQARVGGDYSRSAIQSWDEWGPGVVLEARAMFVPGSGFIDVGFDANTISNPQYAWFSTDGSGNEGDDARLTARVREYDHTTVAIDIPAQYNQWHVYKIVWTVGRVEFYLDGAHVATHTDVLLTLPMHAAFYKTNDSDTPFYIDWIRVTPYTGSTGTLESPVLDAGLAGSRWRDLAWTGDEPLGTSVAFTTRTGESATPGAGWSVWSPVTANVVASPPGRYAQYRAALLSGDPMLSPVIDAVGLSHTTSVDLEPPAVTAAEPDQGTAGVAPGTLVRATFNEPLHPATVDGKTVTLTDVDGVPIAAAVSYSAATRTVTLDPESDLRGGNTYTAHLAASLADTAANRLATDLSWSFTILAEPGSEVPQPTMLHPNVPNPFNPVTRVSFDLGQSGSVLVRVFTIDGKFVRTLIRAELEGGRRYWKTWDGRDEDGRTLPAGTYLVRMETGAGVQTSKMMLVR